MHAVVQLRMPAGANNEQIGLHVTGKIDDIADRVPGEHMGFKSHLSFVSHLAGAIDDSMKSAGGDAGLFSHFLDELRDIGNLFDGDHVEFCTYMFGDLDSKHQCIERVVGAIVGMKNFAEQGTLRAFERFALGIKQQVQSPVSQERGTSAPPRRAEPP